MPARVLLEEFHLTLTVPADTPDDVREEIRRAVNRRTFRDRLRRAIAKLFRTTQNLGRVRFTVST